MLEDVMEHSTTIQQDRFLNVLFQRIDAYFEDKQESPQANWQMIAKIVFSLMWWAGSYLLLIYVQFSNWQFLILYILHGLSQGYILLNIAHDANHNAISSNRSINSLLSYSFDVCGISSYIWRILHHKGHHYCINIQGEDETFFTRGFFRFSLERKSKRLYKYQHIYVFFIYGFLTLDWIFIKDFEHFFFSSFKHTQDAKHPFIEYFILILGKAFYIGYMIIVPIVLLKVSPILVITAFLTTHFIIGLACSFVLQIVHPIESAQFPLSKNEYKHFVYHVLATTADYLTESKLANWLIGGLNLHVIHHIRPSVCHTHFPALTEILRTTAYEHGVEYRENKTMLQAIVKHCKLLKRMGNAE